MGQVQRLAAIPTACGLTGASLIAVAALLMMLVPQPADARPSMGSNCSGCHGSNIPKSKGSGSKKAAPAAASEAAPAAPSAAPSANVRDYLPWTMYDPYYSKFLYRPDDYRN